MAKVGVTWVPIDPSGITAKEEKSFLSFAALLVKGVKEIPLPKKASGKATSPALRAALLVLRDLVRQGWRIRIRRGVVEVAQPDKGAIAGAEKDRVRAQLNVERDGQLRHPAVRAFVRGMETRRIHNGRAFSIFSLMRDGSDLAARLAEAAHLIEPQRRDQALDGLICPYLQFVSKDAVCERTGYKLLDIWRYFRHTWASPYRSIPGRTMMVLVRDAAVEPHPVIGIAALSSAAVQISVRDKWIGWMSDDLLAEMTSNPSDDTARWLMKVVNEAFKEVYVADFIEDRLVSAATLRAPTQAVIDALELEALHQRELHQKFAASTEFKRENEEEDPAKVDWVRKAKMPLFRSKRAELLAMLMRARRALSPKGGKKLSAASLSLLLATGEGQQAVRRLLKRTKSERVGTAMADITVCGAVAPYNAILGGKLISMLLVSPEVTDAYRDRYGRSCSLIASSTAGRAIVRPAELVLLCTTSLYGVGSSQYNRLRMPADAVGGLTDEAIRYEELGKTRGFGSIQFGSETIEALGIMLAQKAGGQRVNSIFGEGVSPRFRKVREGLDALELPSGVLLNHGSPRVVYGVTLARNFRSFLLGREQEPEYLLPQGEAREVTERIAKWWVRRWLRGRVQRADIIEATAQHRLVHPIRHGARVVSPTEDAEQLSFLHD